MNKALALLALFPLFVNHSLAAFDNAHFYRATYFFGEPRFERKGLNTWDITVAHGSTCQSRDERGHKTCLLNLYGNNNMQQLGVGVPCKDLTNPVDIALTNLSLLPARDDFAHLIFNGKFSITEANIFFTQNFTSGFFVQAELPIRDLRISRIQYRDLSPCDGIFPNASTPEWQTFLNLFPEILAKYNLSIAGVHEKGIGDFTLLFGVTRNYQETEILDYIDTTFKFGFLFPTGKVRNEHDVFSLPLGYNGHYGFPVTFDASLGMCDWMTFGMHLEVIPFLNKAQNIHMKTSTLQSGMIKLAQGCACIQQGPLWEAGLYAKADHLCRGFSLIFAYIFDRKSPDKISPRDDAAFPGDALCSDEMFKGWQMHTLNFIAEYDFTKENATFGPRIGLFYNLEVGGKRVFNTSMVGGSFGVDVAVCF